jgi:hypothetical protein
VSLLEDFLVVVKNVVMTANPPGNFEPLRLGATMLPPKRKESWWSL